MNGRDKSGFLPDTDVIWVDASEPAQQIGTDSTFTIATMAKKFGMSLRTLRFYESRRLLAPRREGMRRIYTRSDCDRLALVLKGRKLGFTLAEIKQMIDAQEGRASPRALRLNREKCLEQIALLERQKGEIEEALAELRRIHTALSAQMGAALQP